MSNVSYELVFQGEILDGFDREGVKAEFGRVFSMTAECLDEIFTHSSVVLRNEMDPDQAAQYQSVLSRIGLRTVLRPVGTTAMREAAAADVATDVGSADHVADVSTPEHAGAHIGTRTLSFAFLGRGGEFFKIWIVNVFLTILTFGIYSAWAKVRTQQYFYGNTRLDGASFEYLANPINILKGRVIAFIVFAIYTASEQVNAYLALGLMVALMVFSPWIILRALAFRARNSAYRNVRFGFVGMRWDAVKAFLLWPMLGALTLGILAPYALQRQAAFVVENSRYGTAAFAYNGPIKAFYKAFFILLGMILGGGALFMLVAWENPTVAPFALLLTYLVVFVYFNVARVNLTYGHAALAGHRFEANYSFGSYAGLMLGNMLGIALTLGLYYPWAKVNTARFAAERIRVVANGSLDEFSAAQQREVSALGQEMGDVFDVDLGL